VVRPYCGMADGAGRPFVSAGRGRGTRGSESPFPGAHVRCGGWTTSRCSCIRDRVPGRWHSSISRMCGRARRRGLRSSVRRTRPGARRQSRWPTCGSSDGGDVSRDLRVVDGPRG
jgi:hypothetical protein